MKLQTRIPTSTIPIPITSGIKCHRYVWKFWRQSHKSADRLVTCFSVWELEDPWRLDASSRVIGRRKQAPKVERTRSDGEGR